jgi:predicted RNA binding protein YcfA (HicA-like mRNA interferase family)
MNIDGRLTVHGNQSAEIVARLERDGWTMEHGGAHDLFTNPAFPEKLIVVPRHKDLSIGVSRKIAKNAGW